MPDRGTLIYRYDGSFDGLLCCVFESFSRHEEPLDIRRADEAQCLLYPARDVPTDPVKAGRVFRSISRRISPEAERMVQTGFLSAEEGKELLIHRFLCMGYRHGANVTRMLGDATVSTMQKLVLRVSNEAGQFKEFLRFSEFDGRLVAVFEPRNFVLPLMERHFASRLPEEQFLIYDQTHGAALIYRPYESHLFALEELELPEPDERELLYRRLWKQYYRDIAIRERLNPRCRMSHMPKHFWKHMTEVGDAPECRTEPARQKPRSLPPDGPLLPGPRLPQ